MEILERPLEHLRAGLTASQFTTVIRYIRAIVRAVHVRALIREQLVKASRDRFVLLGSYEPSPDAGLVRDDDCEDLRRVQLLDRPGRTGKEAHPRGRIDVMHVLDDGAISIEKHGSGPRPHRSAPSKASVKRLSSAGSTVRIS